MHFTQRNTGRIDANNFNYHFASSSELIYTPFRKDYYLPPHLNSLNMYLLAYPVKRLFFDLKALSGKLGLPQLKNMTMTSSTTQTRRDMR